MTNSKFTQLRTMMKGSMEMKRCFVIACCLLIFQMSYADETLTPDAVIKAVEQMTPEQAYEFSQKLEARMWEPVPECIFTRLGFFISSAGTSLEKVDVSGLGLADCDLNIEDMSGVECGIIWRVANKTRVGLKGSFWMSQDSSLTEAGYSRAELDVSEMSLALNQRLIEKPRWALWTELDLGFRLAQLQTVNTPADAATTDRYFEGGFLVANAQLGLAWRLNRLLSLYGAGTWCFSSSENFYEGGEESNLEIDASGIRVHIGLGMNY